AGIASGRLQMPVRVRADPDAGPRRRDRQRADPVEHRAFVNRPPARIDIADAPLAADATDPRRPQIVDVAEARHPRPRDRIEWRLRRAAPPAAALHDAGDARTPAPGGALLARETVPGDRKAHTAPA